jgi:hypothetical protein
MQLDVNVCLPGACYLSSKQIDNTARLKNRDIKRLMLLVLECARCLGPAGSLYVYLVLVYH